MALFKISKGLKANLPTAKIAGNCWYTIDDSLFYIDYEDANGVVQRKALNAKEAEKLMGASLATILNSTDLEVPTSKAVLTALAGKSDTNHTHDGRYYTETEIDTKLASKSDTTHKHDSIYDAKGAAATVQGNLDVVDDKLDDHTGDSNIHVTAAKKTNWDTAYTHSQSTHARTDATKVADSTTNGNILINGVETNVYSHPNSGVTAGTYKSVTVNAQGHVTAGSNPTTLSGYGITDAETKTDASAKLAEAKAYADSAADAVKNDLLNGAGAAYDTLKELGELIDDNKDAIEALEDVAAGKASKDELNTHTGNTTVHITATERTNWNAAHTHSTGAHAPSNAEKNQNAFSNVIVGSTTIAADNVTDSLSIAAGAGISVEGDVTNDKVTITNSGVRSIATGSTNGTISVNTNGTSTDVAVKGLGSAAYTASTAYDAAGTATAKASTALGMAKEYTDQVADGLQANIDGKANTSHTHTVANITDLTATATELNYMDGVTSNVQTQLDGKAASGHKHAAADITSGTLSSDRLPTVPISKGGTGATTAAAALTNLGITATAAELNKLDGITATTAELNYVDGVTSNIQTQLNGKAASGHTHDNLVCSTIEITNGASKNRSGGYVKLSNGMILQWGTLYNVKNDTSTWVNFPIVFPTSVGVPVLTGNYGTSYGYELHANDVSEKGLTVIKKGGSSTTGTDTVFWLVIGW